MRLSSDQKRGLDLIIDWLKASGRYFTLAGHAGTGKTTLVRYLLERLSKTPWRQIVVTAPTNKAAKVLRSVVPSDYEDACYTIHAANGLYLKADAEQKYLARRSDANRLDEAALLVIDEASMIDDYLFELVDKSSVEKILYVGDPYQLPPVKDGHDTPAFDPGVVERVYQLRRIVRQADDHPVIALGEYFRACLDGLNPSLPARTQDISAESGLFFLRGVPWIRRYLEAVEAQPELGGVRALAWRNDTVDELAEAAHKRLYGEDAETFQPGQRLFSARPYQGLHTDDEVTVKAVGSLRRHPEFSAFKSRPLMITIGNLPILAHTPDDPAEVETHLAKLHKEAVGAKGYQQRRRWKDYHEFRDAWADLRSVNALTVHRSQGSTFDDVFVDAQDIRGSLDKWRLLYVACTRARRRVFIREA